VLIDFAALPDSNGKIDPFTSVTFSSCNPLTSGQGGYVAGLTSTCASAFELDNLQFLFATCSSSGCTGPTLAPVPEPSSIALLGPGIAGIFLLVRRKFRP